MDVLRRYWLWFMGAALFAVWAATAVMSAGTQLLFGIPPWSWAIGLGALIAEGLWQYHRRRMARINQLELEAEGWQRVPHKIGAFDWVCPYCKAKIPDAPEATEQHVDPEWSACAAFTQKREADEKAARIAEAGTPPTVAEFAGVVRGGGAGSIDTIGEADDE